MPRRHGVPGFRGVAAIVTQALLAEDSTLGWAVLIAQLARTVHLIAEVHVAADQRCQAERLAAISISELRRLQDRFNEVTMAELMPHEALQKSKAIAGRRPPAVDVARTTCGHRSWFVLEPRDRLRAVASCSCGARRLSYRAGRRRWVSSTWSP
jgi:hypothetical protein